MELEEILNKGDDITDPSSMDKILMYLEDQQQEDEEFMLLLLESIGDMTITWEQPWYQVPTCLTRPLKDNPENADQETFLKDAISKAESDRILKNWRKFCKNYNLPNKLCSFARWKNKNKSRNPRTREERGRQFVTAYLARGLQRNLYQVYRYVISHYTERIKAKYTATEKKLMDVCFFHKPRSAVLILSAVLGREPRGIYKNMYKQFIDYPKIKLNWNMQLATKFVNLIIKYTETPLNDLKNKKIHTSVWMKLQDDMGHQHYYNLERFWISVLHVQLFVKCDVKFRRLRKIILKILQSSSYQIFSDIRWKEILKHFPDGFTHFVLYRSIYDLLLSYPGRNSKTPLKALIDYGFKKLKPHCRRRLKTLVLNEKGELETIKYNVKLKDVMKKM